MKPGISYLPQLSIISSFSTLPKVAIWKWGGGLDQAEKLGVME